ncbi:MAG TPA: PIN domain-containing protein [Cyclobacteriaceae bacterium]|nr:PIN domain-containing protein [Cyclobacteriaceae bacterium]
MERLFVDTNIAPDLLQERKPQYLSAARLFTLGERKQVALYFSALGFTTLDYILKKDFTAAESKVILSKFKMLVKVLPVTNKIIDLSLQSSLSDFEDAVQLFTAKQNKIKIIITRNTKDFRNVDLNAITAEAFLKTLS